MASFIRLLKIIGLFCRISSLLLGSFATETYNFKEPTNRSHPIQFPSFRHGLVTFVDCFPQSQLATECTITTQHDYRADFLRNSISVTCGAGSYSNSTSGSTGCHLCPPNTFSTMEGATNSTACVACVGNLSSNAGANSCV